MGLFRKSKKNQPIVNVDPVGTTTDLIDDDKRSYPCNKREEREEVNCVYASPDFFFGNGDSVDNDEGNADDQL